MAPDALERLEEGVYEPSFEELERLAVLLGLRAEDLYDDEVAPSAPYDGVRLLMKSVEAYRPTELVRLRMLDAAAAARDLLELRDELDSNAAEFERFAAKPLPAYAKAPYKLGDELARQTRGELALNGPIPSMRDLAQETLGIPLIAARLTNDGPDAFAVYAPGRRAVIVLNLEGKNVHPLVRRFTIAHEIGHVLYDRPGLGSFGVACRVDPQRGLDIESRANAFAMRLLLPWSEVTSMGTSVLEPVVFRSLMETWGVHYSALRLYVEKSLGLSADDAKQAIPNVDRSSPNRWAQAEELVEERRGRERISTPRRGALATLVLDALRSDRLSYARARELLRLDATVSLEELAAESDVLLDQG